MWKRFYAFDSHPKILLCILWGQIQEEKQRENQISLNYFPVRKVREDGSDRRRKQGHEDAFLLCVVREEVLEASALGEHRHTDQFLQHWGICRLRKENERGVAQ